MRWIAFLFLILPLFPANIIGNYIPAEGENPQGKRIAVGRYESTTKKDGIFWIKNVTPGKYMVYVDGEEYQEIEVNGEDIGLWIYGAEKEVYISRSRTFMRREKAIPEKRSLRESLYMAGNVDHYAEKLTYSHFPPGARYYFDGIRTFPEILDFAPFSSISETKIEHGFPAGKVRISLVPEDFAGFELEGFFLRTQNRSSSLSLNPSYDTNAKFSYFRGDYGGYFSAGKRKDNFSFPENCENDLSRFYARVRLNFAEAFFIGGREKFSGLRENLNAPLESSWSGERKFLSYGVTLSTDGFSISAAHSSLDEDYNPSSFSSSYYDVTYDRWWGGNRKENDKRSLDYLNFSSVFFTRSFLGTNNFISVGGEFVRKGTEISIEYPQEFLFYHGEPSFAILRSQENMKYSIYRANFWIEDSITSGNVNFTASLGYEGEWFRIGEVSSPFASFSLSPAGAIPSVTISNPQTKMLHLFSGRAGLAYDGFRNGFLVLRLYTAFRMAPLPESAVQKAASTLGYSKYLWADDGDGMPEEGEFDLLYTHLAQSSMEELKPFSSYLEPERNYDFGIGVSSDLPAGITADFDFLYRQNTRLYSEFWYIETLQGWRIFSASDWIKGGEFPYQFGGVSWYRLVRDEYFKGYTQTANRDKYDRKYIEWRFNLQREGRFSFRFEFIRRSLKLKMDPSISPFDPGEAIFTYNYYYGYPAKGKFFSPYINSRWSMLFNSSWRVKKDLSLYFSFRARDGYIIPVYYIDTSILRSGLYDYPQNYVAPMGEFRLPTWWRIDLGLSRTFYFGKFALELNAFVYNLTNNKIAIEEYEDIAIPDFLSPRVFNQPRYFVLGIKIRR
ncbi:MAG: hypothetical protein J7L62_01255 [Candidatus Aminicenantes bacterium]|nr:hypothetical protein [Candidatus Aminicenantes bacterium]